MMSRRSRLAIDLALLIGLLVANDPARTGLSLHEWLCVALIVPLLVHLVINWESTVHVTKRFFDRLLRTSGFNLVVDAALFVSTTAVIVSGVAVSTVLAEALGIANVANPLWAALHAASASSTIMLLLVHFVLHGEWLVGSFTALFERRLSSGSRRAAHPRMLENTAAVLTLTALVAVAILLTVAGTGTLLGVDASTATAATTLASNSGGTGGDSNGQLSSRGSGGTRTCPRTGCTASTCHGETGQSPYGQ